MTKNNSIVEKFILTAAAEVITLDARKNAMAKVLDTFQTVLANMPKVELTEFDYAAIDQHTHVENCEEHWEDCELCNMLPEEWFDYWQRLDAEGDGGNV